MQDKNKGYTLIEVVASVAIVMCIISSFLQTNRLNIKLDQNNQFIEKQQKSMIELSKIVSARKINSNTTQKDLEKMLNLQDNLNYHVIYLESGAKFTTSNISTSTINNWLNKVNIKSKSEFFADQEKVLIAVTDQNNENEALYVSYY
ncbi:hypothetical protein AN641_03465 [Candidatus Epulonipiscioides gigas]|nr:hypothetical protein AN641_03465 [Epulopiscium sp. SCG-C07WGA-EpuloA2]